MTYDTSTTEGFGQALEDLGMSINRAALALGVSESTVRYWITGKRPVHPTAAVMIDWLLTGWRPTGWHMTGPMMREAREALGMSQDQMAEALDIETGTLALYESDDKGPPHFVARAVRWMMEGAPW